MNPIVLTNGVWSIDLSTVISTLIACACQVGIGFVSYAAFLRI